MTLLQIPLVITSVSWNLNKATCTHTPAFTFKHAYLYLHQYGVHGEHLSPERGRWIKKMEQDHHKMFLNPETASFSCPALVPIWCTRALSQDGIQQTFQSHCRISQYLKVQRALSATEVKCHQRNAESKRKFKRWGGCLTFSQGGEMLVTPV